MEYHLTDLINPSTFQMQYKGVPVMSRSYIGNLQEGNYVKIRRNQEAFWVLLDRLEGDIIKGKVFYKLSFNSFKIGDFLTFDRKFVFDVYVGDLWNMIPVQPA